MSEFSVDIEQRERGLIVRLTGDPTYTSAESLQQTFAGIAESHPDRIVLDMTGLQFVNSAALSALLGLRSALAEHGGRLQLAGANETICDVLRKTRLIELFPPYHTCEEALKAADQ